MTWGLSPGSVRGVEIGHMENLQQDEREALQFFSFSAGENDFETFFLTSN